MGQHAHMWLSASPRGACERFSNLSIVWYSFPLCDQGTPDPPPFAALISCHKIRENVIFRFSVVRRLSCGSLEQAISLRPSTSPLLGLRALAASDDWELTDAGRRELKDLEANWSRIAVLGGSRGVGKEVISLLSARGVKVVALVRKEESKVELEALPGVTAVIGDALQAPDVIGVLDGEFRGFELGSAATDRL